MSLATRCTACGTIFRVVQDQLKVSEGWVRCGRCQQVFNALQNLFDLDREQPPPWPPVGAPAAAPAAVPPASPPTPTWTATQPLGRSAADVAPAGTAPVPRAPAAATPTAAAGVPRSATGAPTPARPVPASGSVAPGAATAPAAAGRTAATAPARPAAVARAPIAAAPAASSQSLLHVASREPADRVASSAATEALSTQPEHDDEGESSGFLHARFNLDLVDRPPPASPASAALAALHGGSVVGASGAREPAPQFVRLADRAARWQQPRVRALLALLLLLSVLTLLGQIGLQFRAPLAAAWPESRTLLEPMCDWLGCTIEPPRRLDSLTVDASGLSRTATPGVYRLSVALHNHSHTIVMLPAIELSLTDARGQLFARRALRPEDLGVTQPAIAAGADLTLQAQLSTGAERVVGYTVEIFYP